MKNHLSALRKMYTTVINVFIEFAAVFAGYVPFETSKDEFIAKVDEIDVTSEIQSKQIKGFTKSKKEFKMDMAGLGFDMSNLVQAYAASTGNTALIGEMKYTIAQIFNASETKANIYAESIYNAADAIPDAEKTKYKITDDYLLQYRTAIDNYKNASPRDQIVNRKTATAKLNTLFEESQFILENKLDNLISMYRESNPDFYNQYFNARIPIDSTRHTTFNGVLKDKVTNAPLSNVKVTIEAPNVIFEEMTDSNGTFKKSEINPELEYDFTFELSGYEKKTLSKVSIKKGEHEKLLVELQKLPV